MGSNDLIDFDIIEGQKENIQSLPGGRSARKLADTFSPSQPLHKLDTPTPSDTKNINDCIKAEYEAEVANLAESDDPMDIFDRYVQWTLDAYPSAQATPQSGLRTLLERATKTFVGSPQYKNDPRYLKLWIHYISFFSDDPREAFVYLARHGIGDSLALFYEEYAAWLEGASRWAQAEEVYKMGMEREARPAPRLMRKFNEFQERMEQKQPDAANTPSSPALPTVRPALAAKTDPFGASARPADPQAPRPNSGIGGTSSKSGKPKLAVFSDANATAPALGSLGPDSRGWDTIGSAGHRKKENVMEPKPWAGEVLKAGGKKSEGPKMAVFRDPSKAHKTFIPLANQIVISPSQHQVAKNPHNGKKEKVFVDLSAIYPNPGDPSSELCFEEVWAASRGWLDISFDTLDEPSLCDVQETMHDDNSQPQKLAVFSDSVSSQRKQKMPVFVDKESSQPKPGRSKMQIFSDEGAENIDLSRQISEKLVIHRDGPPIVDENGQVIEPPARHTRKKPIEFNETMIVRADMDILDEAGEYRGKEQMKKPVEMNETQTVKTKLDSPTGPKMAKRKRSHGAEPTMTIHTRAATDDIYDIFNQPLEQQKQEDETELFEESDGDYTSCGENTTRNIGTSEADDEDENERTQGLSPAKSANEWSEFTAPKHISSFEDGESRDNTTLRSGLLSPISPEKSQQQLLETRGAEELIEEEGDEADTVDEESPPQTRTVYIPVPPEDYVAPTRPYRDPAEVANNRLPFMTPITERTESSLGIASTFQQEQHRHSYYEPTTPSKDFSSIAEREESEDDNDNNDGITTHEDFTESLSSPLRDVITETIPSSGKIPQPQLPKVLRPMPVGTVVGKPLAPKTILPKDPLIDDMQCNPVDPGIRDEILGKIVPSLISYEGFFDRRTEPCPQLGKVKKWAKMGSTKSKAEGVNVCLKFRGTASTYTLKRILGAGAYAPVYLVESSTSTAADNTQEDSTEASDKDESKPIAVMGKGVFAVAHSRRDKLEALKVEQNPPSAWEFYMLRLAHARLGPHERATRSITVGLEMHLFADSGFLILPYHRLPSLLDVVNHMHAQNMMEETLAMFFTVELLRTVEALHAKGIAHGDIKVDNCFLRMDHLGDRLFGGGSSPAFSQEEATMGELGSWYRADGSDGWGERGITLIDFGRAIDMRAFRKEVAFIADWEFTSCDPVEMREGRPWTWQIDYHGVANSIHSILLGKYMDVVPDTGGASEERMPGIAASGTGGRRYKIKENLKRYWQTDIWSQCFEMLLNPVHAAREIGEDGGKMPLLRGMKQVRGLMETWLEKNCEKGTGLRALLGKVEAFAVQGRKRRSE